MKISIPNPFNLIKRIFSRLAALFRWLRTIKRDHLRPRNIIAWVREQLADPYLKVQFITIAGAAVIAALTIGTMAVPLSSGPIFCNKCHHTNANWDWYKKTAHQNVTCYACHEPPGVHVILKAKITEGPKDIYFETLKLYDKHLTNQISHYAANIPSVACERCHDFKNRKATPSFGLKIDHMAHLKRGINCTRCHNRIGHKGKKGYVDWTSMTEGCFRCHTEERIDIVKPGTVKFVKVASNRAHAAEGSGEHGESSGQEESAGHEETAAPTEHEAPASEHNAPAEDGHSPPSDAGHEAPAESDHSASKTAERSEITIDFPTPVNALNEFEAEQQHHILELAEKYKLEGKDKEEYEDMLLSAPRRCDTCHTPDFDLKPKSHKVKDWAPKAKPANITDRKRYQHARVAQKNVNYCYSCHLQKFCVDCHGTVMPHARPYKDRHGKALISSISRDTKVAPESPTFTFVNLQPTTNTQVPVVKSQTETFCFRCHVQKNFCLNCHGVYFPHPTDWRSKHGKVAKSTLPSSAPLGKDLRGQVGKKACYTCHRPAFCDGCHGGVQMPHSKKWFLDHRATLRTNPTAVCTKCHAKFDCERCHSVHAVHKGNTSFDYSKFGTATGKGMIFDPTGLGK